MNKPKVFIGSSSQAITIAQAIQAELGTTCDCQIWSQSFFPVGRYTLTTLLERLEEFDFSVFVFRGDDWTKAQGKKMRSPRDNVLFEFGICCRAHGLDRAFVVYEENTDVKVLSDLKGLTLAPYSPPTGNTLEAARTSLGTACRSIQDRIRIQGLRRDVVGQFAVSFQSRNQPRCKNAFIVERLKPADTVVITQPLLERGVRALAEQIRQHTAAFIPDMIIGVNPVGAMIASYLDGCLQPGSSRPIGCVKTGVLKPGTLLRDLYPFLPEKDDLLSFFPKKVIGPILLVDSEYNSGRSLRQISKFLEDTYEGVSQAQIFQAVLCLCRIDVDPSWLQRSVTIRDVFRKSGQTPERSAKEEHDRQSERFAEFSYPDFVAFIASGGIEPEWKSR